jgi:hypothetical protein
MIRGDQVNDSPLEPLPKFFAILASADWRCAFEESLSIGDYVRRKVQIVRASFDGYRQSIGFRFAQHIQGLARREMNYMETEVKFAAQGKHQPDRG